MEKQISIISGLYFIFLMSLLLYTVESHVYALNEIKSFLGIEDSLSAIFLSIGPIPVSFTIGYFFTKLNLHNRTDILFFKTRKKIDSLITSTIKSSFEDYSLLHNCKEPTDHDFMNIFYHFINKSGTEWSIPRNIAFKQWTNYFALMNILGLNFIAHVLFIFSVLFGNHVIPYMVFVIIIVFLVSSLISILVPLFIIEKKLLGITNSQLTTIIADNKPELFGTFSNRFCNDPT